jgi:hypothetical protein
VEEDFNMPLFGPYRNAIELNQAVNRVFIWQSSFIQLLMTDPPMPRFGKSSTTLYGSYAGGSVAAGRDAHVCRVSREMPD